MKTPLIIGIAGGTGSGKTTVAQAIYDRVGSDRIEWISHDSYYRNFDGLSHEQRTKINFDHPDSLETELLVRHLDVLAKGSSVEVPLYDFAAHARVLVPGRACQDGHDGRVPAFSQFARCPSPRSRVRAFQSLEVRISSLRPGFRGCLLSCRGVCARDKQQEEGYRRHRLFPHVPDCNLGLSAP